MVQENKERKEKSGGRTEVEGIVLHIEMVRIRVDIVQGQRDITREEMDLADEERREKSGERKKAQEMVDRHPKICLIKVTVQRHLDVRENILDNSAS
jgi:hypothetical protein